MAKIYSIKDKNGVNVEIPSIELLNLLQKYIENALMNITGNYSFNGFPSIPIEKEDVMPVANIESDLVIDANRIKTDNAHQFISKALLATFKNKPSSLEVEDIIVSLREEIDKKLDDYYIRLINTPNAMAKLKDISSVLQDDDILSGLMNALSSKIDSDELQHHAKSKFHLNNNDRKALNLLLDFIKDGVVDWNAEPNSPNYIHNKPDSLPANGGNADTLQNNRICDIARREYDIIIGIENSIYYNKETCDFVIDASNNKNIEDIIKKSEKIYGGCSILFKRGVYSLSKIITNIGFYDRYTNITGVNELSILHADDVISINCTGLKDLIINNTLVQIHTNCKLDNVIFKNCTIEFLDSQECDIKNCKFINCTIHARGKFTNNMVCLNRFITCNYIKYLGNDNTFFGNRY